MSGAAVHRQIIERFWRDLYRRDFDALATRMPSPTPIGVTLRDPTGRRL